MSINKTALALLNEVATARDEKKVWVLVSKPELLHLKLVSEHDGYCRYEVKGAENLGEFAVNGKPKETCTIGRYEAIRDYKEYNIAKGDKKVRLI